MQEILGQVIETTPEDSAFQIKDTRGGLIWVSVKDSTYFNVEPGDVVVIGQGKITYKCDDSFTTIDNLGTPSLPPQGLASLPKDAIIDDEQLGISCLEKNLTVNPEDGRVGFSDVY